MKLSKKQKRILIISSVVLVVIAIGSLVYYYMYASKPKYNGRDSYSGNGQPEQKGSGVNADNQQKKFDRFKDVVGYVSIEDNLKKKQDRFAGVVNLKALRFA